MNDASGNPFPDFTLIVKVLAANILDCLLDASTRHKGYMPGEHNAKYNP